MAHRRNSILLAGLVLAASALPAMAEDFLIYSDDPNYGYGDRSDVISLSAGDTARANLAIQHPTPWPSYVNDSNFRTPAEQGIPALAKMFKRYGASAETTPTTVINIGTK